MIKIIGDRGQGKTKALIELQKKTGIPILCLTMKQKFRILEMAEYQKNLPKPIVLGDKKGQLHEEVLVDDSQEMLSYLLFRKGYIMRGMTLSKKEIGDTVYEI